MARRKEKNQELLLKYPIRTRVTEAAFQKLEKIRKGSNCHSIGEVARRILSQEKILMLHRDISLSGPMEELASIRKELRAIGVNINQLTRKHHGSKLDTQQSFYALKIAGQYQQVEEKVNRLLSIVGQLAEKWLRES
ncbi:plasmid mobilization relaxosome protein MobC [Rufibacter sp. LB8]|uniref:plasmid mobilization relaxosome protein MobC n=1 Tax=Rufibacter sp. LB8 TaxID=2777781 RepID=UPI00178C8251|nr:plasmid mobilization relaxosome protein MobC [Rufibacter sp. LB8]